MLWQHLTDVNQFLNIINQSKEQSYYNRTVLFFKHSTRCAISSMALNRIESKWIDNELIDTYYLDLLQHRDISNEIEKQLGVEHASPQILLVRNGSCFYSATHNAINVADVLEAIESQKLFLL